MSEANLIPNAKKSKPLQVDTRDRQNGLDEEQI
jgi:hypothetical protein